MTEAERWREVGERLGGARRALRLSKREAARRAQFSDVTWRQLEDGYKTVAGHRVLPNPSDDKLASAAVVVGLDPEPIFGLVGREYTGQEVTVMLESLYPPDAAKRLDRIERLLTDVVHSQRSIQESVRRLEERVGPQ